MYSVSCTVSNKAFITWLIPFLYSLVMFMLIIWLIYTRSRWTIQHIQYDVVRSNSHRHDSKQDIRGTVLNIAVNGNKIWQSANYAEPVFMWFYNKSSSETVIRRIVIIFIHAKNMFCNMCVSYVINTIPYHWEYRVRALC